MTRLLSLFLTACSQCSAQTAPNSMFFLFPNGNVYTGKNPVHVELWADWDKNGENYAWAGWQGSVLSEDPSSIWTDMQVPNHTIPNGGGSGPGTSTGISSGGSVVGIINGQFHFPAGGIFASTADPILIWSGEWSSFDLNRRDFSLESMTTKMTLYTPFSFPNVTPSDGVGVIRVVPAPAAALTIIGIVYTLTGR